MNEQQPSKRSFGDIAQSLRRASGVPLENEQLFTVKKNQQPNTKKMCDALSSDEDEEILGMPSALDKPEEELLTGNSLPAKSKEKYNAVYDTFSQWKREKQLNVITERVLLAYFNEIAGKYKPPTLWSVYSMLRSTIRINDNIYLENFKQLSAFLKQKSRGYQGRKSQVFSASQVKTFVDEAPDDRYLATKVVLIFGVSGRLRTSELTNLRSDDILNRGDVMVVKVRNDENKTLRTFTVDGEFLKKVVEYQSLRPKNAWSDRFFLNCRNGRCSNQVIGRNKVGSMPKEIAMYLKLPNPELYTGHSFRRSSDKVCADDGKVRYEWRRIDNCKLTTVVEDPSEESQGCKRKNDEDVALPISEASEEQRQNVMFEEVTTKRVKIENEFDSEEESNADSIAPTSKMFIGQDLSGTSFNLDKQNTSLHFTNCTNITINITE